MKWRLIVATVAIKIPVPYQIVAKQALFIKPTLTVTSLDTNKNVTQAHVKQHDDRFGNQEKSFNHIKHKK